MTNLTVAEQETIGEAWLLEHAEELKETTCPEQSNNSIMGYEVQHDYADQDALLDQVMDEIIAEEAQNGLVWDFEDTSEDTVIEACGNENVATLAHWKGRLGKDESGKVTGTRFIPAKYLSHEARTKGTYEVITDDEGRSRTVSILKRGERGRFQIEWCFNANTGKPVKASTARKNNSEEGRLAAKKARMLKKLSRMNRQA